MNDDVIDDLKQFISAEITQQTSSLATKDDLTKLATKDDLKDLKSGLNRRIDRLEARVDEVHQAIEDIAVTYITEVDDQVQGHEKRIKALELKAA